MDFRGIEMVFGFEATWKKVPAGNFLPIKIKIFKVKVKVKVK